MSKNDTAINFEELWEAVIGQYALGGRSVHGPVHWRAVEKTGLVIAAQCGADDVVVKLFALFHDSRRENDDKDPAHALRGAEYAKVLHKQYIPISDDRFELLYKACAEHTDGLRSANPTIGTCWDADRIDLGRIGVVTSTKFMSTAAGKKLVSSRGEL